MNQPEEQALLLQATAGDVQAFSALLEKYYTMIYRMAFRWLGNQDDSEDVAQEVCIKLGRSIHGFQANSKFSTWVYKIVLNTVRDFQRKQRNHANIDEISVATNGNTSEQQMHNTQLWQLVQQLPDKQRDAVLLVYAEGLSHSEAANVLDCKESTVSWYIHEAKKQLKALMHHD
ncbi:RNA polymerase sigma factor [Endozoicomonas sp. SM1973]|uniref:RNA polymerase sigma factor n=1 Tax=Spartinivicinus marinus TaxID=2994442 RepID=A0A853HYM1_9GAMM|nr:RNA polymerase sigma factor [Spartinivicinus marinus]MCX4024680.1 RNA polymerase sigma factor [Spartinivicinus marinus]NYZ66293.1 RNA polymerase sigma factor [Spartinivicinus marinus]